MDISGILHQYTEVHDTRSAEDSLWTGALGHLNGRRWWRWAVEEFHSCIVIIIHRVAAAILTTSSDCIGMRVAHAAYHKGLECTRIYLCHIKRLWQETGCVGDGGGGGQVAKDIVVERGQRKRNRPSVLHQN